jgi:hypothetical protein
MSWLYSIVLAGLMFSTDSSNVPVAKNYNTVSEINVKKVINFDETERIEQTYPLNANGRVSVSNVNGSITIETWDRNEVKFTAVKTADDKEKLTEVDVQIDSSPDVFSVETDYGNWKRDGKGWRNNGNLKVEYTLTVPRNAVLNEIETVNGSVKISNATNTVRASAVNGEVRATNLRGATNLSTVNGTVEADFDQLQTGSRISLDTVNGTVNLTIPSDANATLRADSVNGVISNDFGLPVRKGQYVGRDLYGKVGTGDVQIKLSSVNGGLSIKRRNDGKTPNPAVNMLQQKSNDNEDWDDNDDDDKDASDMDEAMKTAAKSQKEAAKAMKQAQKELAKIKPEIAQATADAVKDVTVNIAPTISTDVSAAISATVTKDMQVQIKNAQKRQQEAMANLAKTNWIPGAPVVEKKSENFTVKGTPKVTVNAQNCQVNVRGWDKDEVKYSITKISADRSQTPIQFTADHTDSAVNIVVANDNADTFNDLTRVLIEVYVPKKSNLKIVTNREIRLEGVSGELDLSGTEGAINVRDSDGKLRVSSEDGKIRVIGFRGEVDSKSTDGEISLEGDFQKLSAQTVDGTIVLTLPEKANATIESNRKDIETEGVSLISFSENKDFSTWKVGSGGGSYKLYAMADGQVFVRSASTLKSE